MTISHQDEYKLSNGETISIKFSIEGNCWEVACWGKYDDKCRWYKEFNNEPDARTEYERWRK